jgi:hypothetical protein
MPIDKVTINLYMCCKCGYQWTNWDGKNNQEGPIPHYCPKCKNLRWDQEYIHKEDSLFDEIQEQHTVERVKEESGYERLIAQLKGKNDDDESHIMITINHIDYIAYDFLYEISPQPDMFELKQLLAIPKRNIEARHEFMLSVIRDRINNADKYEKERFSKYGGSYLWYNPKRYHGLDKPLGQPKRKSEKPIKGCKHTIQKVRKLEKLIIQRRELNKKNIKKSAKKIINNG